MRSRCVGGALALVFVIAGSDPARGRDEDPLIDGVKLSQLVKEFTDPKTTANRRSDLALTIALGKERAASAVPVLAAALKDKDRIVRVNVARVLQQMGPAAGAAVPELIAALKDPEANVRGEVMITLGTIGPAAKAAVPLLTDVLKNGSENGALRSAAAAGLGQFGAGAKSAAPALTGALKDQDVEVRMASAFALYKIDKGNAKLAVPVLRDALKDGNQLSQTGAVMYLRELGPDASDAVPDLMAAVAKNSMSGYYAREALGKIPAAEAALVAALTGPDKELQQAAKEILLKYYPEAAKKAGLSKK